MIIAVATIVAIINSNKTVDAEDGKITVVNGFYPILDLTNVYSLIVFFTFTGLTIMLGYFGNTAFIYGAF